MILNIKLELSKRYAFRINFVCTCMWYVLCGVGRWGWGRMRAKRRLGVHSTDALLLDLLYIYFLYSMKGLKGV